MDAVDRIIQEIIKREGGYVDHPDDRGGPTKYGITRDALSDWRGYPVTAADVRKLEREEAMRIYRVRYVTGPKISTLGLNEGLLSLVVDSAVHSGPLTAIKWLQQSVGVHDDGLIGPVTQAAVAKSAHDEIYRQVLRRRMEHIASILQRRPSQRAFAAGWIRRLAEFV